MIIHQKRCGALKPRRGREPSDFMREEARTTPFDWPALSALNTSNAGAGGALKPLNSPEHKAKKRRT